MKRILKILRNVALVVVGLMVTIVLLVNYTPFQNFLVKKATHILSEKIKTKVDLKHVRIDLLNHILIQGLYIEDQSHDTLLYAGEIQVRLTDWFFYKEKPVLHYLSLNDAFVHMYRTRLSNSWNYDFISDAFAAPAKTHPKDTTATDFDFDLQDVYINDVRFHMDDGWGGENLDFDVGQFALNADHIDVKKKHIGIKGIDVKQTLIAVREYPKSALDTVKHQYVEDNTPFNPDLWTIASKKISLYDCRFRYLNVEAHPAADTTVFNPDDIRIDGIQILVNDVSIAGDTIHGMVNHLAAHERSGIAIKKMKSKVTVSPVASICDNLLLETNYSKVQNYYAMHYRHFPSFLDYIDSVKMVGRLTDATIDTRDIAYFAPELKKIPAVLRASGQGVGTVADLTTEKLSVTDGVNVLKGDLKITGLPDIDKTVFKYTNGTIHTNAAGVLKYAPGLKQSETIDIEALNAADFTGTFEGLLQNFSVKGTVTSNLGSVVTDFKMALPEFDPDKTTYEGTISTDQLQAGVLLRQADLGNVSLQEVFSGRSFASEHAELKVDGSVSSLGYKGYNYQNITTNGILAKKQFNGKLQVDDPNLSLKFDGDLDYSRQKVVVNSTAHLSRADFKALRLTIDTITASADFDLNFSGDSIDNFLGYAKLYNIDIKRNQHKLDLDSISLISSLLQSGKKITVSSNDITGYVKGDFELSKLPSSIQFYLSKYIPNYISAPKKTAPSQNFEFEITTRNVDSLFAVSYPLLRGFDNSFVSGSLNTNAEKLKLNASVPYATIGRTHMTNISLTSEGNLDVLGLNVTIDNAAIGDSTLSGSLSMTTTLANDSLQFNIATTTPDTSASITLNGLIHAHKDSLFLFLAPSQFFLGPAEWKINAGSVVVYSDKYLYAKGISLTSDLQRITINSPANTMVSNLEVNTENLDLGQLGAWAGIASYQPDGRMNGTIEVKDIFNHLFVSTAMRATNVKLGNDTIGTINIIGSYDGDKHMISLDPQTGVYKDNAAIAASGIISFDSITNQKLDGNISFTNTSVAWFSPFLSGIMSHMTGTVDGAISLSGTSVNPKLDGELKLSNGGMKIDYTGVSYTIPSADVHIDNKRINFGEVTAFDNQKNKAYLTGGFTHNLFKAMRMNMVIRSKKIEMLNLLPADNSLYYGTLVGSVDSFIIRGPFNSIDIHAYNGQPVGKSHLYLPLASTTDFTNYSYISFKQYGKVPEKHVRKTKNKVSITIDGNVNDALAMSLILDPVSGDAINAKGEGNIQFLYSSNTDMRINGRYNISEGDYTYTFNTVKEFPIRRTFKLTDGSYITFNGPIDAIDVNVDAVYAVKARFYDLLADQEKNTLQGNELTDAQAPQLFDVTMHMRDNLKNPQFTFNVAPEDNRSVGTYPFLKLQQMDQVGDRDLFDQVTSLLLLGTFMSSEGFGGSTATAGALNNLSQLASGLATSQLNTLVNQMLGGNKAININVKYSQFNYTDLVSTSSSATTSSDISQLNLGVSKNYFDDRLTVELGSTSDWGKPANTATANNFNINGDFRVQYLLSPGGHMRLNCFRTSDYDVSLDRYITRSGLGLSWRKSFDNLHELFTSAKKKDKKAAADSTASDPDAEK